MAKSKLIEVSVGGGVLRIGSESYPLHNIARVSVIPLHPKRGTAVWKFLFSVLILLIIAAVASAAIEHAQWPVENREEARRAIVIALLVLICIFSIQLLSALLKRTYYALIVETSGDPYGAIVSTDGQLMYWMEQQIVTGAPFTQQVINNIDNSHREEINQYGGFGNIGKQTRK